MKKYKWIVLIDGNEQAFEFPDKPNALEFIDECLDKWPMFRYTIFEASGYPKECLDNPKEFIGNLKEFICRKK